MLKFNIFFDREIYHDTIYKISKEEIKDIIKFYEKFARKYPKFSQENNVFENIKHYKDALKHYPNII